MNSDPLDTLLAAYANQPLPPVPPSIAAGVWKGIETRKRQQWRALFATVNLGEFFRQPRLIVTAFGLALVIGLIPPAAASRSQAKARIVRDSLHFEVFSNDISARLLTSAQKQRAR